MTSKLNPKTAHHEFMGPPGALLVTFSVPLTTYALFFFCNDASGGCPPSLWTALPRFLEALADMKFWKGLFEIRPTLVYLAWYAFCVAAWMLLPGAWIEGVQLRNGERKAYKVNGMGISSLFMFKTMTLLSFLHVALNIGHHSWHALEPGTFSFHIHL
jgi:Delta14-sterol reductase